eukprot:Amastigsp_a844931_23.p2 type:complete len:182 gc:universal Amastigsp_a844931_23:592-47(-)
MRILLWRSFALRCRRRAMTFQVTPRRAGPAASSWRSSKKRARSGLQGIPARSLRVGSQTPVVCWRPTTCFLFSGLAACEQLAPRRPSCCLRGLFHARLPPRPTHLPCFLKSLEPWTLCLMSTSRTLWSSAAARSLRARPTTARSTPTPSFVRKSQRLRASKGISARSSARPTSRSTTLHSL